MQQDSLGLTSYMGSTSIWSIGCSSHWWSQGK